MKRFYCLLASFFVMQLSYSQYYDASPSIVLGAEVSQPVSSWAIYNSTGGGLQGKLRFPAGLVSDIILTGTLSKFSGKTTNKKNYPGSYTANALAGYRIYLSPLWNPNSFYLQADGGISMIGAKIILPTFSGAIGYLINDRLDIALRGLTTLSNIPSRQIRTISLGIGYGINL